MAKEYQIQIPGHPNLYDGHSQRELNVYFCEPDAGINEATGLLLLISDFGESARDADWKVRRSSMSDQYNLITVQCEYFGSVFMGNAINPKFYVNGDKIKGLLKPEEWGQVYKDDSLDMNRLLEIGSQYPIFLEGYQPLDESVQNFNEMGLLQAIDNITALLAVRAILNDNKYTYNPNNTIVYGHGHAAYLGYLANVLAPSLFHLLIDHNGWLIPPYINAPRTLGYRTGQLTFNVRFEYMASQIVEDKEIYSLPKLYKNFQNQAHILSFNHKRDATSAIPKRTFCESINLCMYNEFSTENEQSQVPSNYDELFQYVMRHVQFPDDSIQREQRNQVQLKLKHNSYYINYESGMPIVETTSK
jgi:hypothetical protein